MDLETKALNSTFEFKNATHLHCLKFYSTKGTGRPGNGLWGQTPHDLCLHDHKVPKVLKNSLYFFKNLDMILHIDLLNFSKISFDF